MKPAGLSKFFAYFFILSVVIQPTAFFGMFNTPYDGQNFGNSEQSFYTVSLKSSGSSRVLLASKHATLSAPKVFSADAQVSVVGFNDSYPELKVIALDFSRVKISVVNRQTREVVLKVLPVSLLFYIASGRESFDLKVLGVLVLPLAINRFKEKNIVPSDSGNSYSFPSSETPADFSLQSILVLRC